MATESNVSLTHSIYPPFGFFTDTPGTLKISETIIHFLICPKSKFETCQVLPAVTAYALFKDYFWNSSQVPEFPKWKQ